MQRPISTMARANQLQMKKLLDILGEDGILVDGKVVYHNTTRQEFWKNVAHQLNAIDGGVYKNPWKWCKVWADWKNKTKNKGNKILNKWYSLEEPKPALTGLEYRLLKLIGFPVERIEDTEPMGKLDLETPLESIEFLEAGVNSDADDVKPLEYIVDNSSHGNMVEFPVDDPEGTLNGTLSSTDESDGLDSLSFEPVKPKKVKKFKRRKTESPITYNISKIYTEDDTSRLNGATDLERHRLRQKDEELRLKALELKLKGDELKLKEAEMTKVNTLVNIEEEKLRCFKDVASLLKELVDRTKNGNPARYNSII